MYFNIVICFIYIHERLDYALKTVFLVTNDEKP